MKLIFLLIIISCSNLWAQKVTDQIGYTTGFIPAPQVAAIDDAWAINLNPAGLSFIEELQIVGGYQFEKQGNIHNHHMQTILGYSPISGFAIGIGGNLIIPSLNNQDDYTGEMSLSLGAAYRYKKLASVGISGFKRRDFSIDASDPFLLGLGTQIFPLPWLAVGLSLQQSDKYFASPFIIRPVFSFRPIKEWLTLGIETAFVPRGNIWEEGYAITPAISARGDFNGVFVSAGAVMQDVVEKGVNDFFITAGVGVDLEHVGAAVVGGGKNKGFYTGAQFRYSSQKWPTIMAPKNKWIGFVLAKDMNIAPEKRFLDWIFVRKDIEENKTLEKLQNVGLDESVEGVVLYLRGLKVGLARAHELRNVIIDLQAKKKKVWVYFDSAGMQEYYVASVADKVFMNPKGTIDIDDF